MFDLSNLEQRLAARQRMILEIPDFRQAAVLVGIQLEPVPRLVLTERSANLSTHSGQIAFPGGSLDATETPIQAALREANEEIGLEPSAVHVLGLLDDVWTPAGFHVTPVLAVISSDATWQINTNEVAQLLFVPITDLQTIQVTYEQKILPSTARIPEFESRDRAVPHYLWGNTDIWGMTAFVIQKLLPLLSKM